MTHSLNKTQSVKVLPKIKLTTKNVATNHLNLKRVHCHTSHEPNLTTKQIITKDSPELRHYDYHPSNLLIKLLFVLKIGVLICCDKLYHQCLNTNVL